MAWGERETVFFHSYELPQQFPKCDGNYIYAKNAAGIWLAVYIGEGDLSTRCTDAHHCSDCINEKGATHIHVHRNEDEDEDARKAEEADLLAGNAEAYEPLGCNMKRGG